MQLKKTFAALAMGASSLSAATVDLQVTEDQWIGAQNDGSGYGSNATVAEGGTGDRLNLWIPGPPSAWQYNRRAYFQFDVSGVNLADVTSATFRVTTANDVTAGEIGKVIYYWIHDDAAGGFDETTLSKNVANDLGLNANGAYLDNTTLDPIERGTGTLLDLSGVALAALGTENTITFSGDALAALAADSDGVVVISAYAGTASGGGYGGAPNATDPITTGGPGFISKEGGTGAVLTLEVIPEPSTSALFMLGSVGFLLRRRKS
ncbi:hypothetical protein Rhal01_00948 [Rubritalea halochordaticola]|uniref:Ice-binding protein C-terminal domain-containing protein n=1 Tax=Rubritalea halochordaticola TaxID=714537 RepID=A0ABP9UYL3_9BACT